MHGIDLEHLRDLATAADPGHVRFHTALRATLTAAVSALVLSRAAAWVGVPGDTALLGVTVAMLETTVVADPRPRGQRLTLLLLAPVASVAVTVGMLAAPARWLAFALFCAVVFAAVLVRRAGQRGTAIGMIAFMAYFASMFFAARAAELPWIIAGIFAGTAIAYAMRFWIIRDRPRPVAGSTRRAFLARCAVVLHLVGADARATRPSRWRRHRLRVSLAKLNETALMLETEAGAGDAARGGTPPAWTRALFEVELGVETFADAAHALALDDATGRAREWVGALAGSLGRIAGGDASGDASAGARAEVARLLDGPPPVEGAAAARARARLRHAARMLLAHAPVPPVHGAGDEPALPAPLPAPGFSPGARGGRSADVRVAIQATIAAALAILAGRAISTERWYWAVIAAFVVHIRAATLDEAMSRAWERLLGTVGGVVGGLVIAELVRGHHLAEVAGIFVCMFGTYYLLRLSYAWMVVFLTALLAVLYDLLGEFSPGMLVVRLEETLAGALIAVVVSAVVFPTHSGAMLRRLAADVIRRAIAPIRRATSSGAPPTPDAVRAESRRVDLALEALRAAAAPMLDGFVPVPATTAAHIVRHATVLAYCVRHLVPDAPEDDACGSRGEALAEIGARLADDCAAVADALDAHRAPDVRPTAPLIARLRAAHAGGTDAAALLDWLDRIDRVLVATARTLGAHPAA